MTKWLLYWAEKAVWRYERFRADRGRYGPDLFWAWELEKDMILGAT